MKKCKITPIIGGPKMKYYCEVCRLLADEPNPPCPDSESEIDTVQEDTLEEPTFDW